MLCLEVFFLTKGNESKLQIESSNVLLFPIQQKCSFFRSGNDRKALQTSEVPPQVPRGPSWKAAHVIESREGME